MKKKIVLYCLILSLILPIHTVYATTSFYIEAIEESATSEIAKASSWEEALRIYQEHEDSYDNLLIRDDEKTYKVKYGFLAFHKSATCDVNISYTQGAESGYTNGCYGIDAAYLSTSNDGERVSFLLSGAYGSADIDDVDIYPMEEDIKLSTYRVTDKKLYHQIKTDMSHDLYSNSIYLGDAPTYLQKDIPYYSYDGHYFYQEYTQMIDDIRNDTFANAHNTSKPYYNYFQYVTHRTKSAYSEKEINAYLDETLHIQSPLTTYKSIGTSYHAILTQSMLKSQANAFLQYQDQFGANALMMLALSMNESASGRSYLAYTRNNVFGHAAFDSAVEENASRYTSIAASIYSHAKYYISNSYLQPQSFTYHGGFFGSKASGMNVSYASDPYWGEKAAQYYTRLDEALGDKDKDAYALGIITQNDEVSVYKEASRSSDVLYTTQSLRDFSFVLLEKQGAWYKIQSDPAANENGRYMFSQDIGYVSSEDIDIVVHEENMKQLSYHDITFNANGGSFQGDTSTITLQLEENRIPSITTPSKEGEIFTGWDSEVKQVSGSANYTARYKDVMLAEIINMKKTTYQKDEQLDVGSASLKLTFSDGEVQEIPLDSSMVTNFDTEIAGTLALQIEYFGISTVIPITIEETKEEHADIVKRIEDVLASIPNIEEITSSQKLELHALKQELDELDPFDLPYATYRKLDLAIQEAYGVSLQILVQGELEAQVSGLSIATELAAPSFFPTVLKFNVSTGLCDASQTMLSNIAIANEYTPEIFFELSGSLDFDSLNLEDDIIVAIKKRENSELNKHYLLMQFKDNNVYQIPTSQSNSYITFTTDSLGEYALVSRNTANIYAADDLMENNSKDNNGLDIFKLLFYIAIAIILLIIVLSTIIIRKKRDPKYKVKDKRKRVKTSPTKESSFLSKNAIYVDEKDENLDDE